MRRLLPVLLTATLAISGCAIEPFQKGDRSPPKTTTRAPTPASGSAPVLTSAPETPVAVPGAEPAIEAPAPAPLPKERPKAPAATLGPASKALVSQAEAQRKKGDLPGATVTIERALRIEPNNPLLWIEMGRLRMDQRNYPQAESMGRKALAMSVGDDRTQSQAWQLIADSYRARGKNVQAQEALDKSKELSTH